MAETAEETGVPNWDLGTALVLLRTVAGLTQEDLATASGVRSSSLSDYERGKVVPGLNTLRRILKAEGYSLAVLEEVAASAANVAGRMVRLHFAAMYHQAVPVSEDPTPAATLGSAGNGEEDVAA